MTVAVIALGSRQKRFGLSVLDYIVTSNHIHLRDVARSDPVTKCYVATCEEPATIKV
jgi:hypothetical protein